MPQTCSICRSPHREAVDAALVAGEPYRHVASRYGTSTGALQRHKPHVSEALTKAKEAQGEAHGKNLLSQVQDLVEKAQGILNKAKDDRTALVAVREVRGTLELLARLTGELQVAPLERNARPLFLLPVDAQVSFTVGPPPPEIDVTPKPGALVE